MGPINLIFLVHVSFEAAKFCEISGLQHNIRLTSLHEVSLNKSDADNLHSRPQITSSGFSVSLALSSRSDLSSSNSQSQREIDQDILVGELNYSLLSTSRILIVVCVLGSILACCCCCCCFCVMTESSRRFAKTWLLLVPIWISWKWLKLRTCCKTEQEQEKQFDEFHEEWADEPLKICLNLRGFYIKIGQILSAVPDVIPQPYAEQLSVLQENVPPQPFPVIVQIMESELGCPYGSIFTDFEEEPIGAASIGQVHMAKLKDGTPVVVKVQYPETERYFRLDFALFTWFFTQFNPDFEPMLKEVEAMFADEFDYRGEAANLRKAFAAFRDYNDDIHIPEPLDAAHPKVPKLPPFQGRKGLITKRVLVMERCPGISLTKLGNKTLQVAARMMGTTTNELKAKAEFEKRNATPAKLDELLKKAPSDRQLALCRALLKVCHVCQGEKCLKLDSAEALAKGPLIAKRIFQATAHCLFEHGKCNPDPHPGNILYDEATEAISLLDYGQLTEVGEEMRANLARMLIGIAEGNQELTCKAFFAIGNICNQTGAKQIDHTHLVYAIVRTHVDGIRGYKYFMEFMNYKNIADALAYAGEGLPEVIMDSKYAMVQRCFLCLCGSAAVLGVWSVSPAEQLAPAAKKYLQKHRIKFNPD